MTEKVICGIREFDFRDDGEKICPCLVESIIMCVYTRVQFTFPHFVGRGEHLISPKLVFIAIRGKLSFVTILLFSTWC